jgi:hypothetical protein
MKNIVFKWIAISSVVATFALFVSWGVSFSSDAGRAQLAFSREPSFLQMALANGKLILCNNFANREVIELVDRSVPIQPALAKDVRRSFPGFTYRHLTLTSGQGIWSLSLSLLIPSLAMTLLAAAGIWRLRVLGRRDGGSIAAIC